MHQADRQRLRKLLEQTRTTMPKDLALSAEPAGAVSDGAASFLAATTDDYRAIGDAGGVTVAGVSGSDASFIAVGL